MANQSPNLGPDAPVVDATRLEGFYRLLSTLHVELDPDPLELGPKRINEKIATCRGHLSKCERVYLEVSQDLHWYKRRHRLATATHALKVQELLANDPEVRAGRNVTDREAVANIKLRADKEVIDFLRNALEDLESVKSVITTKRDDLRDIQGRLRDQLKVCQEEIALGARWGTRTRMSSRPSAPTKSDMASRELDSLMDEALVAVERSPLLAKKESEAEESSSPAGEDDFEVEIPVKVLSSEGSSGSDESADSFLNDLVVVEPSTAKPNSKSNIKASADDFSSLFS